MGRSEELSEDSIDESINHTVLDIDVNNSNSDSFCSIIDQRYEEERKSMSKSQVMEEEKESSIQHQVSYFQDDQSGLIPFKRRI